MIARIISSRYLFWLILASPALPFLDEFINPTRYYPEMMQRSGVLSIQILVLTLSITPVTLLIKRFNWGRILSRWLLPRRKYLGIASAAYAFIHTLLYLRYISWDWHLAWLEGLELPFATGWVAMILFVIVAAVSNKIGLKILGRGWKNIQRLTYPIVILAFAHWLLLDFFIDDGLLWIVPLVIAKCLHVILRINQSFSIWRNSD